MPSHNGPSLSGLPVNFHITRACNFSCGHCFATFEDVNSKEIISRRESLHLEVVSSLANLGASKITFSGGEPLLVGWLPRLLRESRDLGLTTCVVTNGSLLTEHWLSRVAADLDWLTLSVDSVTPETNVRIGRAVKRYSGTVHTYGEEYSTIMAVARSLGIGLKVNTVVTRHNQSESLVDFIAQIKPVRWKIMQAMPVQGQNQGPVNEWGVSDTDFEEFIDRHRDEIPPGVVIVPEPIDLIRGSYIMVDPWGRIFDSTSGRHRYLMQVQEASSTTIERAVDQAKLIARGGIWDWDRPKLYIAPCNFDYTEHCVVQASESPEAPLRDGQN